VSPVEPGRRLSAVQVALFVGSTTVSFQNFVVIPAIPAVGREFGASPVWATWLLTGFLLVSSIAAPLLGRVGDQFGKRRVLLCSMSVFFLGSIVAAVGPTIGIVIAGRALQGIGGAVIPLAFSIVRDVVPPARVGRAVAFQASSLPVGTTAALVAGGLVDVLSWRYVFGMAACLAGVATVLIAMYVPESTARVHAPLDVRAAALLTGGLVSLLLSLTQAPSWGWTSARIVVLAGTAALLLAAWVRAEMRAPHPMVEIHMLMKRPVLLTNATSMLTTGFAIVGALVLLPLLLAAPRGYPAAVAAHISYGFHASTTTVGLYMFAWAIAGLLASV
jgi:MFS family permease